MLSKLRSMKYEERLFIFGIACVTAICLAAVLNRLDSAIVGTCVGGIVFIVTRKKYKPKEV